VAHGQHTHRQYHLPAIGKKIASKATRTGVAARFPDPAGPQSIAGALALIASDDRRRRALELSIVQTARHHEATPLSRLQTVPGVGKILRWVLLYELHEIHRFPRVQDCVSACRLVKCATDSAGKRSGTAGKKIGNADLKWAFSAAAVLVLGPHAQGQKCLARLEKQPGTGNALPVLAPPLARAVYDM
jgi:transposase